VAPRRSWLARVLSALTESEPAPEPVTEPVIEPRRLLPAPVESGDEARATVGNGAQWLNGQGYAGMAQVRTATPQEYTRGGATIRIEGFNRHPVVQACIRVIVDQVAQIPYVVMSGPGKDAKRVGPSHPLQQLLDHPGGVLGRVTARQIRSRAALDMVGYGNALWQLERALPGRGKILGIRPLNVEGVQTVWVNAAGDADRWDVSNWNGLVLTLPATDLVHFRDLEMARPFQPDVFGYPRGAAAIENIIADREATGYVRQVVTNDGSPPFLVFMEQGGQGDALAAKERYVERIVRRGERGAPVFMAGVRDAKSFGFTLSELEFPNLRKVAREDICSAFGVDPRIIGSASASNDAGLSGQQYAEARSRLIQHTVEPLLGMIVDELNAQLSPYYGNVVIDYDRDVLRDLVEDDEKTSARVRAEVQVPGLRTLEEARVALKLPANAPVTDTLLVPFGTQLVPVAAAVIDPKAVVDTGGEGEADDDAGDEGDEGTDAGNEGDRRRALRTEGDPRYDHWLRQIKLLDADEVRYAAAGRAQFREDKADVAGIFARVGATAARALPADQQRAVGDAKSKAAAEAAAKYAPGGEYHEAWRQRFETLIRKTYQVGNTAEVVGTAALDFRLPNAFVERAVLERATRLATYVGETTAKQITAVTLSAERAGLSIAETSRLIQQAVYGEHVTDTRARTIARTESAGAMSQGQWDQASESGIYQSKAWLAFDDAETRETHRACHAEGRVAIGQAFAANGMQFPMEPGAPPGEVINCRCRPIFYIEAADEAVL
jgi:HK97 family phage portal protein